MSGQNNVLNTTETEFSFLLMRCQKNSYYQRQSGVTLTRRRRRGSTHNGQSESPFFPPKEGYLIS